MNRDFVGALLHIFLVWRLSECGSPELRAFLTDMFPYPGRNVMKKRKYIDLYGYTQDEFDHWLESGINKKLRSAGKSRSELDMDTVFAAYKDETRKLLRRRLREMRIIA
ncbi:hypothetical protein SAMN05216403_1366 [Nitrosospira multiformis ATCC 25196]|uniref:Uncharacterized protein n=2 Tax=Nitrosospira multiformis TaxID=1231 RepID=Q2YAU0_NITMU|nr:hypothetical protein Nmul_A0825 [Nitrosospira multiformis ATCC 25196]SEG14627.1 hypothetical protein SAMN05216403_1366 [Nitrosospira multiformis ATCC 25196]